MSTIEQRIPRVNAEGYGGDQDWFPLSLQRADGCGAIAAANLYYYYRYPLGSAPEREEYLRVAEDLYRFLRPLHLWNPFSPVDSYGLPFFSGALRRMTEYFLRHGIIRRADVFKGRKRLIPQYIKNALQEGDPVLLLTMGKPGKSPYNNHYLLVTGLEGDRLTVSTWGQRRELSLGRILREALHVKLGRLKEL